MIRTTFAAVLAVAALAGATTAHAASDKAFIKEAMEGDNSEVALGKIAEQKGSAAAVRDFGHMLDMDHSQHKTEAVSVAQTVGAPATDAIPADAQAEARKLDKLSGAAFDHEFARYAVKDHKKDIAAYEAQAKGSGPTADLARKTLPTLHKHLDSAMKLTAKG